MEDLHYTAFISYRHTSPDEDVAKKLHTLIETYHIPANIRKKLGISKMGRVFRDQEELPLSKDLGSDIRKALENSDWLIVIASPRYLLSEWCNAELDYFISLGKRDHILTLLVEGEPEDSFPPQLLHETVNGVEKDVEPLAGDVRAASVSEALKKLNNEKLRILAPMLNVNYDELRQRARQRKTRIISTAVAAVFVLMSGFLIYAMNKNKQITQQRNLAMNNQMQLLVEQANVSTADGNRLLAIQQLLNASEIRKTVGNENDTAFAAALEYALYNEPFSSILTINNNNRQFDNLVFSHDDRYLLGITNFNTACLIDAKTGQITHTVSRSDVGQLDSVDFTLDDKYFYTVDSWYNIISMYDVETGEPYREFAENANGMAWNIGEKAFAMEDHTLLIVKRQSLVLWDYENNTQQEILPTGNGTFEAYTQPLIVDLSPDRKDIVVGSHGYGIGMKILSLDGRKTVNLEFNPERGYQSMMYSGDGRYISGASGAQYCVWEASTGKMILLGEESDTGQTALINYDGSILLVMSSNYLKAIDVRNRVILWEKTTESNFVTEAYISSNGKYVAASGGIEGVFDLKTGEVLYDGAATLFSNDSRMVIAGSYGNKPVLLSTPELATIHYQNKYSEKLFTTARYTDLKQSVNINLKHYCNTDLYSEKNGHHAGSYTSPDTKYGVYCHYDGFMEVFDITDPNNSQNIACIAEHCFNSVSDLIFNGNLMASCGGYDPRCVLYDLKEGKITYVLAVTQYCGYCEFSPDGSKIIIVGGYQGNQAYVYSTLTGNLLYHFTAPEGRHFADAGFTNDGKHVTGLLDDGNAIVGILYPTIDEMLEEAKAR